MKILDLCKACGLGVYDDAGRCGQCGTDVRFKRPKPLPDPSTADPRLLSDYEREWPYARAAGICLGLIVLGIAAMYVAHFAGWLPEAVRP